MPGELGSLLEDKDCDGEPVCEDPEDMSDGLDEATKINISKLNESKKKKKN